ncbi:hypothetical protein NHX12_030886 [Muraenolepis orangiensis]|uniref:Reverse transcriptase domain-containing protein n=1 Tax=Muraenolepis orangiensis TaxID=630683 RepID=A0A9Q0EB34_9TELE|nr:hypothetical protein NHX12_030886 [Muraenolepis orangiensis]
MDAPTSFFFGLEKKNGQRRVIHLLLSGTGQEITEPSQIRRRAVSFYSTLYTSEYEEGETLSEGFCNGLPQVSEEANSQLEGPLTIQELQTALQGMQGRRAPGIDGLSVEFYRAYWDVLSNDLLDIFNESLASGSMPVSCRRAVITLLPKKGNLQDIKNWRPVSLLCVDYKLLSKALVTRLGRAVEQVIHRDQTYCVPGRSMVDNVLLIRDVLEVSSSLDINTGLISLDQEKAFDRVEHSFLWKVKFGFSAGFIAKIKVLYNNIESVLKFNGGLCAPFRVCRGVQQGCALSGMLYALSLEPLLNKIRSKLQGLFLPGFNGNMVLSVYADDVVVFVRDQNDIDSLVDIVREFSSASAARVNWKKSEALAVARLDVSSSETPGLTVALCRSMTLCLQQLVDAVGPELSNAQALGSLLGLHSVRVAQRILQLWSQILCPEEKRLLRLPVLLTGFFSLLTWVFNIFGIVFTESVFIMGAPDKKSNKEKWQLLNYLSGESKMAIYLSRKNRIENWKGEEAKAIWLCNIRARLWLEHRFSKHVGDLDAFKQRWCHEDIVCSVVDEDLHFAQVFKT